MENHGMFGSSAPANGSVLQDFLNRVFRCRHRRKTYPFTPKGEKQCYAVCLDCGQRLGSDMQVIDTSPKTASPSREAPRETIRDSQAHQSRPTAPTRRETVVNHSPAPDPELQNWKYNLLWVGLFVVGLSGGLYFSGQIRLTPNIYTAQAPAQLVSAPSSKSLRTEQAPEPQGVSSSNTGKQISAAISTVSSGPKPEAAKPRARAAISAPEDITGSNQTWRLGGKSPFVVLGLEAPAVLELSEHPARLGVLIQSGSLFTVPRGTAIKVREEANGVVKILILEGSMAGREGWAHASQVRPMRHRSSEPPAEELHQTTNR